MRKRIRCLLMLSVASTLCVYLYFTWEQHVSATIVPEMWAPRFTDQHYGRFGTWKRTKSKTSMAGNVSSQTNAKKSSVLTVQNAMDEVSKIIREKKTLTSDDMSLVPSDNAEELPDAEALLEERKINHDTHNYEDIEDTDVDEEEDIAEDGDEDIEKQDKDTENNDDYDDGNSEEENDAEMKKEDTIMQKRDKTVVIERTDEKKTHALHSSNRKYLIYVCDSARSCGGWGDRQRGIVSSFVLANITGRKFGIIMTSPCNLTKFYVPNEVNWIISKEEVTGKSNVTVDDMDSRRQIIASVTSDGFDFNVAFPSDVIYLRTNVEYVSGLKKFQSSWYGQRLPLWAQKSVSNTFRIGWNMLMKPTDLLQKDLDGFLKEMGHHTKSPNAHVSEDQRMKRQLHPLVCAHVRLGRSETIKMDTEIRTPMTAIPVLWEFVGPYIQNGSKLFLATDSYTVRSLAKDKFGDSVYHTDGKIMHVDKQASWPNACDALRAALLDQLVLTKCDVLVTSRSIFSQRAAAIRGSVKDLYILYPRKVRKMRLG